MGSDYRRGDDAPKGRDDYDFRRPEYREDGGVNQNQPKPDDDDSCGGQVMGWVVMIGIIGGIYLVSSALGFPILLIPIPRR